MTTDSTELKRDNKQPWDIILDNSDEMDKFLKRHKSLNSIQEEIKNLNRPISSKQNLN